MEKIILTAAGALLIGLTSVCAQQDDSTRKREQSQKTKHATESKRKTTGDIDEARRTGNTSDQPHREMVIVQPSEVPSSLRETLQDPKYEGWENAIIYHNTRTDEYLVSPRPYRFSSQGKEIGYGITGYGNRNNSYGNQQRGAKGSLNQHRRNQNNTGDQNQNDNDGERSKTYSTNPNQDSTGLNATESSAPEQELNRSDESSSFRKDSTPMNSASGSTNSNSSDSSSNSNASTAATSSNNSYTTTRVDDQNLPAEGMVLVEENEVPENLKETLRDSDYSGWQRGKLYNNPATGEYILIMGGAESGSDEQHSFRFDKNGKLIKDKNMNGRGHE